MVNARTSNRRLPVVGYQLVSKACVPAHAAEDGGK
jgi:hypothetical protein